MSEKRLKFKNIKLNKKEFHKSKEPTDLLSVDLDQIVVSYKFKHNDEGILLVTQNTKLLNIMHYFTSNGWVYKIF